MHLYLHAEGVQFLKVFGTIALLLSLFVLRFSAWIPNLFVRALERAPEVAPDQPKRKDKSAFRRKQKDTVQRASHVFKWLLIAIGAAALVDLFIIPADFRIRLQTLWPPVAGLVAAAFLILFLGPAITDGRANWQKWTFWTAIGATITATSLVARAVESLGPMSIYIVLAAAWFTYVWTFGMLRRIDRVKFEAENTVEARSAPGRILKR